MKSYEIELSRLWRVDFDTEDMKSGRVLFSIICVAEDETYACGNVSRGGCFNLFSHEDDLFHGCGYEDTFLFYMVYGIALHLLGEEFECTMEFLGRPNLIRELN